MMNSIMMSNGSNKNEVPCGSATVSFDAKSIKDINRNQDKTTTTIERKKPRETFVMSSNTPDQVSKKIGFIVDEFKCSHNNFHGILYVGPLAVIFLGRILLFEWTVVIKVGNG
jgi:hypothetical protein